MMTMSLLHLRKKSRNDDKPLGLLSSTTLEKNNKKMMMSLLARRHFLHLRKNQEMTTSLSAHCHLLHLRKKKQRNDDVVIFYTWQTNQEMTTNFWIHHLLHLRRKTKRWQWSFWLVVIFYTWEKKQEDDDEPGDSFALEKKTKKR